VGCGQHAEVSSRRETQFRLHELAVEDAQHGTAPKIEDTVTRCCGSYTIEPAGDELRGRVDVSSAELRAVGAQ
jgi:hypothetical protein